MTRLHYATPAAFEQALEQRLESSSENGTELARRRQLLVFDRFLARVAEVGDAVILEVASFSSCGSPERERRETSTCG